MNVKINCMTQKQYRNLLTIKEHLKDSAEKHRVRLSELWQRGVRSGFLFTKLNEQRELMLAKIDDVDELLCPSNPYQK